MRYLCADIGSTYTKLTAIDSEQRAIVAFSQAFTTIETNVTEGFNEAWKRMGCWAYDKLFVCSSAAGGLKMVALGLVPDLTAKAARTAAANAGAKVAKTFAYEISKHECDEIQAIRPDLILLCGGTDGGNKEVILANAKHLVGLEGDFVTIVAGNKSVADEIKEIFDTAKRPCVLTENVMPVFNQLNIQPARDAIRQLFIARIIEAKGLAQIQAMATCEIIPTPLAVLNACELLARGTKDETGWGELMAVDIGGATTDVYSMAAGLPDNEDTVAKGLPEPWAKRTVEGDLGMRYSLPHVLELVADASEEMRAWVKNCIDKPSTLAAPQSPEERMEEALGRVAVSTAVERHCGKLTEVFTPLGKMRMVEGKDLTRLTKVIGIGGVLKNSRHPDVLLSGCKYTLAQSDSAKPLQPQFFLDKRYIFAAMGLLAQENRALALYLLKTETKQLA